MSISIDCLNFITGQQYAGCVKVVQLAGLDSQKQQQQQKVRKYRRDRKNFVTRSS